MKLVRLATDNNGYFKSSFQNDMIIKKNSKIALLNLTIQTDIGTFIDVEDGVHFRFKSDVNEAGTDRQVYLQGESFNTSQLPEFYDYVEYWLNKLPVMGKGTEVNGAGNFETYNSTGSEFKISQDEKGFNTIKYRYAPFINPFLLDSSASITKVMDYNTGDTDITLNVAETIIKKAVGEPATADRSNTMLSYHPLASGCGFWTARIKDFTTNASGLQDNGFGIGLSKRDLITGGVSIGTDIPAADRHFEIRFNRTAEAYTYIDNNGVEKTSTIMPQKTDLTTYPDVEDHDVLAFEIQEGELTLAVYQDDTGVGERNVLATVPLEAGERLYPYIYLRGASTSVAIDMCNFNVTPFMGQNRVGETNDDWDITGSTDDSGLSNGYTSLADDATAVINSILPNMESNRFDSTGSYKANFLLDKPIWRALGFTQFGTGDGNAGVINKKINGNPRFEMTLTAQTLPIGYTSDNFIVESVSLPLDSFDASAVNYTFINQNTYHNPETDKMGRRKNILMTIPVNDNTSGLVEYEASTPIFIDINNSTEINQKNLDFRVLRKDFSPVEQGDQLAIMTLLIDN